MSKSFPETHQKGLISIEKSLEKGAFKGDLGLQVAEDGRVWVCINGEAIIRFKPQLARFEQLMEEKAKRGEYEDEFEQLMNQKRGRK